MLIIRYNWLLHIHCNQNSVKHHKDQRWIVALYTDQPVNYKDFYMHKQAVLTRCFSDAVFAFEYKISATQENPGHPSATLGETSN